MRKVEVEGAEGVGWRVRRKGGEAGGEGEWEKGKDENPS